MKRIIAASAACLLTLTMAAQSAKVVSAKNYLTDYERSKDPESLQKAKENINLAAEHADTKENAKTHVYRGMIYIVAYDARKRAEEDKLQPTVSDPNKRTIMALQNTPVEDLEIAYQSFAKAKTLDVKGNWTAELRKIGDIGLYFDNVGRALYNAKKFPEALSAFEKTYEISGSVDTTALSNAAISAERAGNFEKAKTYYNKMAEGKQGAGNTYSSLMNVHLMGKDTAGALAILKKGRETYPNDINLLISETNFYLKANKSEDALKNLNLAIQAKPADANLYLVRGNIYDNLANPKDETGKDLEKPKDYEEKTKLAETDYKKAIELKPDYFDALYNLGVLYNNHGVALAKLADKITDNAKYAAENAKATEEFAKAMPVLEKAHQVSPKDRATMMALKQIYARMQQTDKLKEINEKLKNN
jgi:tetratricopeptide (TPR) repeat protein